MSKRVLFSLIDEGTGRRLLLGRYVKALETNLQYKATVVREKQQMVVTNANVVTTT